MAVSTSRLSSSGKVCFSPFRCLLVARPPCPSESCESCGHSLHWRSGPEPLLMTAHVSRCNMPHFPHLGLSLDNIHGRTKVESSGAVQKATISKGHDKRSSFEECPRTYKRNLLRWSSGGVDRCCSSETADTSFAAKTPECSPFSGRGRLAHAAGGEVWARFRFLIGRV